MTDLETGERPAIQLEHEREALRRFADRIEIDPQTNSVFALARDLFTRLQRGEAGLDDVDTLIHDVFLSLMEQRAERFRAQHFGADPAPCWQKVRNRLEALAAQGSEAFTKAVETPAGGIVFTAHPTFALALGTRAAFAAHVASPSYETRLALSNALQADGRDWSKSISLTGEHDEVQRNLVHAQGAMNVYARLVFEIAEHVRPQDWRELRPALPTLASWVGYDLDGRTDIHWSQSLYLRLSEKAAQLGRYAERLDEIAGQMPEAGALARRLAGAGQLAASHADLFARDLTDAQALLEAANALTAPHTDQITDAADILAGLNALIETAEPGPARALCILRAQVEALQLGTARIHLRVNAAQVRTVISRDLQLETEDSDLGRLALRQLAEKAAKIRPRQINFEDLFLEQSTARRQFMMCAQILKHIDAGSTIRFLIAESENPATVMGALYLARQYGVGHALDISPLFETPEALETGGRFIERLLEEPVFMSYLGQRGYLSIQLGFSDAGRFIGQVAADMAIERIHNLICRALARKKSGVGLLIFNTHGESFGRGAWPGPFEDRFNHVLTPWTRIQSQARDIPLRHEVSFQGGDGFLHFETPALAETTYGAYCGHLLSDPGDARGDPFYSRTDFVWDFYRSLRAWHERLFDNVDYGHLLSDFATNLLIKAGSRQQRRTGGPAGPRALRAISHNATLQQLGVPVNTAGGIGSATRRETDRLVELIDASPRMRSLVHLALHARRVTSVPALRAYGRVYDPDFWVALSRSGGPERAPRYRSVYYALKNGETSASLSRTANIISIDLGKFDRLLARLGDAPSANERHEERLDLHVLHAARQALMMEALALAGTVPSMSERHDASARDVMVMISEMRIADAVALLCRVFPASTPGAERLSNLTEHREIDPDAPSHGYDRIHEDIIGPLDAIDRLLHATTLAIAQAYDAYG